MEKSRRDAVCQGLERLGHSQGADGKFHIQVPLRKLEKTELEQIFYEGVKRSGYPRLRFNDLMENMRQAELEAVKKGLAEQNIPAAETEDLEELVEIHVPAEEHLRQVYRCDIGVDTGDGCSEYTLNTIGPNDLCWYCDTGYHLYDRASIVWLTKQQGYKKRELAGALHLGRQERIDMEEGYLKSAVYEVWHGLTLFNQLFFFLKLSLEDMMLITTAVQWHYRTKNWAGYIVLDRETRAGFFDRSSGSGSLMRIQLEKDVKLPMKYIDVAWPDNIWQYSARAVYGDGTMWNGGGLQKITVPKKFRRDMEELGFDPQRGPNPAFHS